MTPLHEARLENVKLCTELRELREEIETRRWRSMEIAAWTKRFRKARDRAEAHKQRVTELENAIASWLVGDIDEDGLAAFLTTKACG